MSGNAEANPAYASDPMPTCLLLAEAAWGSALHAARSLGPLGVPVLIATPGHGADVYRRGRFVTSAIDLIPDDPSAFARKIEAWVGSLIDSPVVVTIPLSDRFVEVVHESRDSWSERYRLLIPSAELVPSLLDKRQSLILAAEAGLTVPPWRSVADPNDLHQCQDLRFPVSVRASRSAGSRLGFKVKLASDMASLRDTVGKLASSGETVIVQEYIEAPDHHVEFGILWRSTDGSQTVVCTGRKCRQSGQHGGVMVWGETTDLADVRAATVAFLDEVGFRGLGGIEFIRSEGMLHFIEFNPRLEAIHFLAGRGGIDTVRLAYTEGALGQLPQSLPAQRRASGWVEGAAFERLRNDPRMALPLMGDWIQHVLRRPHAQAVWSWRDPGPALALVRRLRSKTDRSRERTDSESPTSPWR